MTLVGGVRARGLTTFQLASAIAGSLKAKYVKDPKVKAGVVIYRPIFVLGEVKKAGQFPFVNGITVEMAVAMPKATPSGPISARCGSRADLGG